VTRAILWDFDGTLATRPGLWSACVIEVLDDYLPGHALVRSDVAPFLESRFPWHDWATVHDRLGNADAWWEPILALIVQAMVGLGVPPAIAPGLAEQFRRSFLDPARWMVYEDSAAALRLSSTQGWRDVIVSNHVPELPGFGWGLGAG
jgi:putative hydrolase of the HAD superfamily